MTRAIFIPMPELDDLHFMDYLRARGWRVLPDDTATFEVTCHPPDEAVGGCGSPLAEAVIRQSAQDLRALFVYLELQRAPRRLPRTEPPHAENPDA